MKNILQENIFNAFISDNTNLIISSPHSGHKYPSDFQYKCDIGELQSSEDRLVNEIFKPIAIEYNVSFIEALFPRTYVDLNRAENDMNPMCFENTYIDYFKPSNKAMLGHGVFHTKAQGRDIYNMLLNQDETDRRIVRFYRPYHEMFQSILNHTHTTHEKMLFIDCHSMPSKIINHNISNYDPDFVIGDLDGNTCELKIRKLVCDCLQMMNYNVSINNPFKGAYILKKYANPATGINGIQLEINKRLYMDERNNQIIGERFNKLQTNLKALINHILLSNI